MPRATWVQNCFNGGEWSPLAYGRMDTDAYKKSLATCKNYIPTVQGGLTRRPGTMYVANTAANLYLQYDVRLIPFEFSTTQAYILEFGQQYVRFYTNDGLLYNYSVPYSVVTPYDRADLADLSFTQSADVIYIAHPKYRPRKLMRLGATNWALNVLGTTLDNGTHSITGLADGPYLPTNVTTTTLTVAAPSPAMESVVTASSVTGINGGAGFLSSDLYRPIRVKAGAGGTGWGIIRAITDTTHCTVLWSVMPTTATATTTWRLGVYYGDDAAVGTKNYPSVVTFHQDRLVFAASPSYPSRIDASNTSDYENFAPTLSGGTTTDSVVDSNALAFTLNSAKVNAIRWILSDEWGLLVGTTGGEWVVAASSQLNALTPTNVTAREVSSYGSANVRPVKLGRTTMFVQRTNRKVREFAGDYSLGLPAFKATDVTAIAEHLTIGGLSHLAVQQSPQPVIWVVRTDGGLIGLSYDKELGVLGWHQHQIGGWADDAETIPAQVRGIAVIPSPDTTYDEVWLTVYRRVNGADMRTVERLVPGWESGDKVEDAYFVDCGATYYKPFTYNRTGTTLTGTTATSHGIINHSTVTLAFDDATLNGAYTVTVYDATTFQITTATTPPTPGFYGTGSIKTATISGLTWLVGQTVKVLGDGATHPDCEVDASGNITLQRQVSKAQVGLGYTSTGKTLRIEAGGADGTAQGKYKRIHRAIFRFFETVGMTVQATNGNAYPEPWRSSADRMDNPVALYTGDKRWAWEGSYELEGQITWSQTDPLPSNVLMVVAQLETQDGG